VHELPWRGSGPEFTLSWCGRPWSLVVDATAPGLCREDDENRWKLLSLDRLAGPHRSDHEAFTAQTLIGMERYRDSVRATYAPPGWDGLVVRASWSATARGAIDLEVQVSASSVGELEGLEVGVLSRFDPARGEAISALPASRVEPRDAASAALTYDGREPLHVLRELTTLPVARPLSPRVYPFSGAPDDLFYVEMAHPDDVARRISAELIPEGSALALSCATRYGLFGHALEKGVILRARLRGIWLRTTNVEAELQSLYQDFLRGPLPLGP
jgi:hypothetical protein